MTPILLRTYLQSVDKVSLAQITQALAVDEMLSKQLIRFWQRRGKIKLGGCQTCFVGCEDKQLYSWDGV